MKKCALENTENLIQKETGTGSEVGRGKQIGKSMIDGKIKMRCKNLIYQKAPKIIKK